MTARVCCLASKGDVAEDKKEASKMENVGVAYLKKAVRASWRVSLAASTLVVAAVLAAVFDGRKEEALAAAAAAAAALVYRRAAIAVYTSLADACNSASHAERRGLFIANEARAG